MLLSEGQMSDYKGAALMIDALPAAKTLLGDKGYDADWLRTALAQHGIAACIPSKSQSQGADPTRHRALPPPPQDRDHVRKAQGLAPHPHPATIDAQTPSCPPSASPQPSSSGSINES